MIPAILLVVPDGTVFLLLEDCRPRSLFGLLW